MDSSLIERSPFFIMDEDRLTGRIVFISGDKSRKLYTKYQAKQFVYSLREIEFDDAEIKVLIEMIENSTMVESDTQVEQMTDRMAEIDAKLSSGCMPDRN